jgi:hypothetical protein
MRVSLFVALFCLVPSGGKGPPPRLRPKSSTAMGTLTSWADRPRPLPDSVVRFGTNLPFRDPSGLAEFPVDGPQLPQSRVVIRVYEPEDHFTRSLTISGIRLEDWEAQWGLQLRRPNKQVDTRTPFRNSEAGGAGGGRAHLWGIDAETEMGEVGLAEGHQAGVEVAPHKEQQKGHRGVILVANGVDNGA